MLRPGRSAVALIAVVLLAGCNGSSNAASTHSDAWGTKTSAGAGGGMNALISMAKAEGQVNVIGLPHDWADYGNLITSFSSKYGIKVDELTPGAVSADELDAATLAGRSPNAPDVFDLNMTAALGNTKQFAPYKVSSWDSIPGGRKEATGLWFQDYGGFMAVGEDTSKLPVVVQVDDLLQPAFKGKVALRGDPMVDDSALAAIMMVALNEGGTLDDIGPGVDWFHKLKVSGNFLPVHATNNSVKALQTPVVLDWDFLSLSHVPDVSTWQVVVPGETVLGIDYAQAINKDAPHPAAARLWEEFLYSATGQNGFLQAGFRPVEMTALQNAGTLDATAAANLPQALGAPVFPTPAQMVAARVYLAKTWAKAIG